MAGILEFVNKVHQAELFKNFYQETEKFIHSEGLDSSRPWHPYGLPKKGELERFLKDNCTRKKTGRFEQNEFGFDSAKTRSVGATRTAQTDESKGEETEQKKVVYNSESKSNGDLFTSELQRIILKDGSVVITSNVRSDMLKTLGIMIYQQLHKNYPAAFKSGDPKQKEQAKKVHEFVTQKLAILNSPDMLVANSELVVKADAPLAPFDGDKHQLIGSNPPQGNFVVKLCGFMVIDLKTKVTHRALVEAV